ncbi:hypothetical protein FRB96_007607 [Tulasnella sp. 330]|nr:hypothetical protein FRB96_007607 [Tulasnella sp. 330]
MSFTHHTNPAVVISASRRIIPLVVVLFNFILFVLGAVDLTHSHQFSLTDSYVQASQFLCIASAVTCGIVSIISYLNYRDPGWMPYSLFFEYGWAGLVLCFQFIAAVVLSAESTTSLCNTRQFSASHPVCGISRAALGFVWMSFLLLLIHLALLTLQTLTISRETKTPFLRILKTAHEDLVLFTSNHTTSGNMNEKPAFSRPTVAPAMMGTGGSVSMPRAQSPNGGLGGKRKAPPRPLDFSNLAKQQTSTISLPIYRTFVSTNPGAATMPTPTTHANTNANARVDPPVVALAPAPNRHQMMAVHRRQLSILPTPDPAHEHRVSNDRRDSSSDEDSLPSPLSDFSPAYITRADILTQSHRQHHQHSSRHSDGSINSWSPPQSWSIGDVVPKITSHHQHPLSRTSSQKSTNTNTSVGQPRQNRHRRGSKQLPALPDVQQQSQLQLPRQPGAVTFRVLTGTGGVVDRPDPRDRRPAVTGSIAGEGGFWVTKATRMEAQGANGAVAAVNLNKAGWI